MDNNDLEVINKALAALRDHFEQQGKTFLLAWYLAEDTHEKASKMRYNLMTTTASSFHLLSACSRWTGMAVEHIDQQRA